MRDASLDALVESLGSRREARWVLEDLAGLDDDARRAAVAELVERRGRGEPLQYLVGHWQFRGLDLLVDRRALIPRPETEPLVDLALEGIGRAGGPCVVADLGCGTGAIALSVATEAASRGFDVEVHATDLSGGALALAGANASRVGAPGVRFHQGSWFEALPGRLRGAVTVLCANPPYVAHAERAGLAVELDYEPELALVADDAEGVAGFAAVAAVIRDAPPWLVQGGTLLVEHGDAHRAAAIRAASEAGFDEVVDHDDLAGHPRILEARAAT